MATHLYGNLPESRNKELNQESKSTTAWSDIASAPSAPFAEAKEETNETPKERPTTRTAVLAPPPSVLKKRSRTVPTGVTDVHAAHREAENTKLGCNLFGEVEDEYDPAKPNDYEAVMEERERKKREAELEAEKQELLLQQQQQQFDEEEHDGRDRKDKRKLSVIDEEGEGRRNQPRLSSDEAELEAALQPPQTGEGKGMVLAEKLLKKFGWQEGQGLGKERQGIATPLIAQKTDKHSAVIVKAEQALKPETADTAHPQGQQIPHPKGTPTRVVLLRNLVGPGEVDDDLEEEVALELQKFGEVQAVLIFEVTEDDFPPEEAVRIFVQFRSVEESQKAAHALNGRFFGGRIVRAGYYNEAKFGACDLAPVAGEFS